MGSIAATIQAPNLSITSGGQIQNVGNLLGSTVTLTGTKLINGITGNLYTPSVSTPSQVISLAPATSGGMSLSLPNVANTGSSSASGGVTYVISSPGGTSAAQIGPANLIAALPANLQPSSDLFYYNPQEQDLVLQQAALTQTGEASFINCLSCSASGLSVADQDTALLYQNAVTFATANSIQLGTALTQSQIASLTQPILWYVDETVPDPSCTATGGATCPTVTALMPQVYLPPNYNAQTAEGNIEGSNVTLNFDGSGGSVLNTGNITASNTLTVNTPTLTNQQNSTNVGQIWNYIQDTGYEETTGTMAQPGGTMSAGNMVLNVQAVNQIGGALQQLNTDGSVDTAATQQLLSTLQAQLGSAFQQSTVTNDLQTSFVKEGGDFSAQDLAALVVAVVATIATYGAASTYIGGTLGAEGGTFAAAVPAVADVPGVSVGVVGATAGLGNIALSAGIAGAVASAASQVVATGNLNLGTALESGLVSAVTAGLTNGITYNSIDGIGFSVSPILSTSGTSSLAGLAGVESVGNSLVPQANAAAGSLSQEVLATAADATISAGVQTAIEGGSFLNNLKTDATQDAAADLAYAIGNENLPIEESALAHAALGCAASAAEGTGCAGGAIGAASSALLTPFIGQAVVGSGAATTAQTAVITALAALTGGVTAGLAGANAQAGAAFAENEAQNNCSLHECWNKVTSAFGSVFQSIGQWMATPSGQTTMLMVGTAGNTGEGLGGLSSGMTRAAVAETATELAADTLSADTPTLFRGTTQGYPGNPGLQQIGITPTTSNPAIATVFATGSGSSFGNGIVQIAEPADLVGIEISSMGNASTPTLAQLESEFAVSVAPSEFTNLSSTTITAAQARSILSDMNISIPSNIGVGDITSTLENTPQLTSSQIQQFLQLAKKLGGNL